MAKAPALTPEYTIPAAVFRGRTGNPTNAQIRLAEALKIIKPYRTPYGGQRIYSEADVRAMRLWEGNKRCPARSGPRRKKQAEAVEA